MTAQPVPIQALETEFDTEGTQEILQSFLEDTSGVVEKMEEAMCAHDHEQLRSQSHLIRGTSRAIRATELTAAAKQLETCATSENWQGAADALHQLKTAYERVDACIRSYLSGED